MSAETSRKVNPKESRRVIVGRSMALAGVGFVAQGREVSCWGGKIAGIFADVGRASITQWLSGPVPLDRYDEFSARVGRLHRAVAAMQPGLWPSWAPGVDLTQPIFWGAIELLRDRFNVEPLAMSGAVSIGEALMSVAAACDAEVARMRLGGWCSPPHDNVTRSLDRLERVIFRLGGKSLFQSMVAAYE